MKIDRMISIIMILLERERVSAQELADSFEVSVRTIYRDLDSINQAGIPIVSVSGPGNGVSILKSYKVEKRIFSTTDIANMLMALGSIQSSLPGNEMVHTLMRVKNMVPEENQAELSLKAGQLKIDLSPWLYSGTLTDRISTIKYAVENRFLLQFDYRTIKNAKSSRCLEPCRLLLKGEDWYVQGFCLIRQDFRTFKMLRMENLVVQTTQFTPRPFPEDMEDTTGFNDIALFPVKLRIHEDIKDMILARFGEESITADGDYYYIARIHIPDDDLAYRYLLGFGTKCQCLDPPEFRRKIQEMAMAIYQLHQD